MSNTLFDAIFRDGIGFETLSRRFNIDSPILKYPPHNIVKFDENRYDLVVAVAGFSREELDVSINGDELTIKGAKTQAQDATPAYSLIYSGLAMRDFSRVWKLSEYVEVTGVRLADGLLTVSLERKLPDSKRVRSFNIA